MIKTARRLAETALPATLLQRLQFRFKEPTRSRRPVATGSSSADAILRSVDERGFAILPGYLTTEQCALGVREVEDALNSRPEAVWRGEDERIFGAEHISSIAQRFADDPLWLQLADAYAGEENATMFIMANRITCEGGEKLGSGGGWHRDGFNRALKVIVYLSDVEPDNGPFQLVERSHSTSAILADIRTGRMRPVQNRLDGTEVDLILQRDPSRLRIFPAKAGTAIVFDTSSIHTGAPIQKGARFALTNYIATKREISPALLAHYRPRIGDNHSDLL